MSNPAPAFDEEGYVPFAQDRIDAYLENDYWTNDAFHDVLDRVADERPDDLAAVDPAQERTYGDLATDSRRIAAYLSGELGLGQHDRVVFQLSNRVEFLQAFFACSRIGAIPVMLLPRHREAEARHIAALTDARAYVTLGGGSALGHDYVGMVEGVREASETLEHTIVVDDDGTAGDDWIAFEDLYETDWTDEYGSALREVEVNPCDPGVFLLSGGTTGMPKAIPRTYNDYVYQWRHCADTIGTQSDWSVTPCVPVGHNAALNCVVGEAIHAGATVVLEPVLKPESLMDTIEVHDVTYFFAVPAQLVDFLEHPDIDDYEWNGLEAVMSGGQKVRPRLVYELNEDFGTGFLNIFGMAEGPLICTTPEDPLDVQAHTVGRPVADADEIRIVDQERESEVEQGEAGELACRGPGFFTGYFRNEEENEENFDEDGWFYSEDVLRQRDDGRYEVLGRIKDTIIRGGENIYAPGVEDEIIEHPAVENVAVIGMPDERLGERPAAYVELAEEARGLSLETLQAFLDDRGLAVFKHPERLEIVDELPRTEVDKIDKASLKDRITGTLQQEGKLPDDY